MQPCWHSQQSAAKIDCFSQKIAAPKNQITKDQKRIFEAIKAIASIKVKQNMT